jgi:hypothetical protein
LAAVSATDFANVNAGDCTAGVLSPEGAEATVAGVGFAGVTGGAPEATAESAAEPLSRSA